MADYAALYAEETCIGRGNFGAAMLVSHKKENGKKYIAKKIMLQGLSPKEQEGCMMEVNLLKNLDHPNIVSYKESFLTSNQLVIVMEYCEGKFGQVTYTFSWRSRLSYKEKGNEEGVLFRTRNLQLVRSN